MCIGNYFNFNQPDPYREEEIASYDRLLTWIFDETVIYQEDKKIIRSIVSCYDKLPLNI